MNPRQLVIRLDRRTIVMVRRIDARRRYTIGCDHSMDSRNVGLLDELEEQAERQREEESKLVAERALRERHWEAELQPAMVRLDAYLKKLVEHLAFLKKRSRMVYELAGYGEVVSYVEPTYTYSSSPGKHQFEILLEFSAGVAHDECSLVIADNLSRVRSVTALLQQHQLGGMSDTRKSPNGDVVFARFQAKGRVPMSMQITADAESGAARFAFHNFEGFGSSGRNFTAEHLNDTLFDALGRFVAREEIRFAQEAVGVDLRRQLQNKLKQDEMRREWETKLSRQLGEDEAKVIRSLDPGVGPGWLLGRLRLLSVKLFGR